MEKSITIKLFKFVGGFAENKDTARNLRVEKIVPALNKNKEVIIDFGGVESTTQSFIHALISDLIRSFGNDVLDSIAFKNCNETVQKVISIVVEYMQQSD
jgi:hypothetical protein